MRINIHALLGFTLLLLAVNMLLLDVMVFSTSRFTKDEISTQSRDIESEGDTRVCSTSCKALIDQAIGEKNQVITPGTLPPAVVTAVIQQPINREFYIPLGIGTTKNADYEEITGAEAYINRDSYPGITKVTFEVFLRNPTGNGRVYAKLYNVTDKHDVWYSEVFIEGNGVTRKEMNITLEPGNKLYRVMLKSTLRYDAYVDAARIKIVTQ